MINKKYRIFIVISVVWVIVILAMSWSLDSTGLSSLGQHRQRVFNSSLFLLIGALPIVLFWGFNWIFKEKYCNKIKYSAVIITCPNEECKQKLRFKTAKGVDTKVICPKCKMEFINLGK
jgi:hypothetical protein